MLVVAFFATCSFASEYAVMRNGFALKHERREVLGEITRLYLTAANPSSFVDVPSADIVSFEKDEIVIAPEEPKAAPLPALTIDQSIAQAGEKHHIDPDFINSVVRAESGFHPRAVSHKGAQGLMQLMPKTAAGLGVKDSFDSNENVEAGTRYLRQLLEQFNYDAVKALAAYNAGPERVTQYHGVPPYRETRAYVAASCATTTRRRRRMIGSRPNSRYPARKLRARRKKLPWLPTRRPFSIDLAIDVI